MSDWKIVGKEGVDDQVDQEIAECLRLESPRSFFLFAGAGSGKTRSLTKALRVVLEREQTKLRLQHQQVGVITYTNAACLEIKERILFNPLIEVSTIHSFVWSQIGGFTRDIKSWLSDAIQRDIEKLREEERRGRTGTRASENRRRRIAARIERLETLDNIRKFTYNPDGDNVERESLDHNEVIQIGSDFLSSKSSMQKLLVTRFPILLIDESQDTHASLMEALFSVQAAHKDEFVLGLFGDTMQRIYGHGKPDLGVELPADWARPAKEMNYRCPRRVIELTNRIRADADGQLQKGSKDQDEGVVRLFVARADEAVHEEVESRACSIMASLTGDDGWSDPTRGAKTLTLEHHMAARRLGFLGIFETLNRSPRLRTGLLDGTLPELRLFGEFVLPLVEARSAGDEFQVSAILRKYSPILSRARLQQAGQDQSTLLKVASKATEELVDICASGRDPLFIDVLKSVLTSEVFSVPESLKLVAAQREDRRNFRERAEGEDGDDEEGEEAREFSAWEEFLGASFSQIAPYQQYVSGNAVYGTHQGVKGLEFPRVMVIFDDSEARGFLFRYEKVFGVSDLSATDLKNQMEGKETSVERTRRLLYVTCSRAQKSLALVLYTNDPEKARQYVTSVGWLAQDEIELIA